jgi:hypothetical protein
MNLISNKYQEIQKKLHDNPAYGSTSRLYAKHIANFCQKNNIKSVCDYGVGKMRLLGELKSNGFIVLVSNRYA